MEINENNFENFINDDFVLIDFFAEWCGPCKMMTPIIETLQNVKVAKVNVDKCPNIAKKYAVMSIPTLILFKNGVEVSKKIGYTPEILLNEWINENK